MASEARFFSELDGRPQPPQSALNQIVGTAKALYGLDAGALYFPNYLTQRLECLVHTEQAPQDQEAPRIPFDAQDSLASRAFRENRALHSESPSDDPGVYQPGVRFFNIRSPLFGAPLRFEDRPRGVVLLWSRQPGAFSTDKFAGCLEFVSFAGSYLAAAIKLEEYRTKLGQLSSLEISVREKVTQEEALQEVMLALREYFDRVLFFRNNADARLFVPIDCLGMDRERFLQNGRIPHQHAYAAEVVRNFPNDANAHQWEGSDPYAEVLGRPPALPCAYVPLGIGSELIGLIVADNPNQERPITDDAIQYLDAISALAVTTIASRESIQFLSLTNLPILYNSLSSAANKLDVIKRLLVFLTCGESLGFSRGIFLEFHKPQNEFVYRASIGSLTEERFHRIAPAAANMRLEQILVQDTYDYEIHQRLNDFTLRVSASTPALLRDVQRATLSLLAAPSPDADTDSLATLPWTQDLANRIGETEVLTVPLQIDERILGMFIVDRRWQPRPMRNVDLLALRTFSQIAAQILDQHEAQQRRGRKRFAEHLYWTSVFASHTIRTRAGVVDTRMKMLNEDLANGNLVSAVEQAEYIARNVVALNKYVDRLASLTKVIDLQPKAFALRPLLREACQPAIADGIQPEIDCPERVTIIGDRDHLWMCFEEILMNSIHSFDKEEKQIRITVGTPSPAWIPRSLNNSVRYTLIHFEDNGRGIDPKDEDQIFDFGFTSRSTGSGIGLSATKEVVELNGGMVTAYSQPGVGTTIAVFLPLAVEPPDEPRGNGTVKGGN